ncbi:hypothetical protein U9M48_022234 [Paspalum notatum var. saurae]|uniref:BHLH domain-containing protein n=1 Tax=Paspalum notatum var. saurae TaxID=547442 RepID=A0AAQ3WTG8_PASNO
MALVREHSGYGGFDGAEAASAFDALLGFDAASLFGAPGGPYAGAGAGYVANGGSNVWPGTRAASSSVLAFDRATAAVTGEDEEEEECDAWIDAMDDQIVSYVAAPEARRELTASVGFDASTGCFTLTERAASSGGAGRPFGLLFPSTSSSSGSPERAAPARASQKRAYLDAEPKSISAKKPCGAGRKTSKAKSAPTVPTKDPQSLAAKNRRERISERLRTLQELVPNGTKVDLVTMLEKAISYVKFLQLQVNVRCCYLLYINACVLHNDLELEGTWCSCNRRVLAGPGGKAPEISQVREALDAILSSASQRGN